MIVNPKEYIHINGTLVMYEYYISTFRQLCRHRWKTDRHNALKCAGVRSIIPPIASVQVVLLKSRKTYLRHLNLSNDHR